MKYIQELINSLGIQHYRQLQGIALASIFVLIYSYEHIKPQRKSIIDYRHELFNFAIGVMNQLLVFLLGIGFYLVLKYGTDHQIGLLHLLNINLILKYICGFVLMDCFMYWWHRSNHEFSFLWFFHRFHHKDTKLNSTSALRFHVGELVISLVTRAIAFGILGIEPLLAIIYESVLFCVIVLHHSNVYISEKVDLILRKIFVSPRMHRTHHSTIFSETNSNYSSVFPYWDMLFKTYTKMPKSIVEFGIPSLTKKVTDET